MTTTASPRQTTADLFETKPCSRCGGCGHYSFNPMYGTRCFKCAGAGYTLTRRGALARDAWKAGWTVLVPVRTLQPGDKVMVRSIDGRERLHVVTASNADELNPGRWTVSFDHRVGGLSGHGFISGDDEIRLPASRDDKRRAYEAIAHMPGATGNWQS